MQRFKKPIRLLTEKNGGVLDYGADDSLTVTFESRTVRCTSVAYNSMDCSIDLGDGPRTVRIDKSYVFDIIDRLSSPHLSATLRDYPRPPILQLADYISEEHGGPAIQKLRERVVAEPSLLYCELGGNRLLVEFYHGVLIISDDLAMDGTNVVDL